MRLDQLQLIPALRARWRHVVLTCALIVGAHPDLRPFEIKTLLKHYASRG